MSEYLALTDKRGPKPRRKKTPRTRRTFAAMVCAACGKRIAADASTLHTVEAGKATAYHFWCGFQECV